MTDRLLLRKQTEQEAQALSWVARHPAVVITIAGAALFGALRVVQNHFYAQLGTSAGEIGSSYAEVLASFVSVIAMTAAFYAAWLPVLYALTLALERFSVWWRRRREQAVGTNDWKARRRGARADQVFRLLLLALMAACFLWLAFNGYPAYAALSLLLSIPIAIATVVQILGQVPGIVVAVVLALGLGLVTIAVVAKAADDIALTRTTFETQALTPLGITAEYVTIESVDEAGIVTGDELLDMPVGMRVVTYLGTDANVTVIFDQRFASTVRFPSSQVVVKTANRAGQPGYVELAGTNPCWMRATEVALNLQESASVDDPYVGTVWISQSGEAVVAAAELRDPTKIAVWSLGTIDSVNVAPLMSDGMYQPLNDHAVAFDPNSLGLLDASDRTVDIELATRQAVQCVRSLNQ